MKVTIWGINYAPELTGIAPYNQMLGEHLHHAGHSVRMVTSFPYYPTWKKDKADQGRLFRTDDIAEMAIQFCRRSPGTGPCRP